MTRSAVRRQWKARLLVSLLAAAGVAWSGVQPAQQAAANSAIAAPRETPADARETLRVGMWTLWHDREVERQLLKPSDALPLENHDL